MSISSLPPFVEVDLGSKHEEFLRKALLNDEEIDEDMYPILVTAPYFDGKLLGDFILPPDCVRVGANRAYRCLISGLLFTFFVGSAPLPVAMQQLVLRKSSWPIARAKVHELPFLYDACLRIGRANLFRKESSSG
jgi:hypothetical protein